MYTHKNTYKDTYISEYQNVAQVYIWTHVRTHVRTHIGTHVRTHVRTHIYRSIRMLHRWHAISRNLPQPSTSLRTYICTLYMYIIYVCTLSQVCTLYMYIIYVCPRHLSVHIYVHYICTLYMYIIYVCRYTYTYTYVYITLNQVARNLPQPSAPLLALFPLLTKVRVPKHNLNPT